MTSRTSGVARCWARNTRNTACSSRASAPDRSPRSAAIPGRAWPGTPPAVLPVRGRNSAGRCESAPGGCAPGSPGAGLHPRAGCGRARRSRRTSRSAPAPPRSGSALGDELVAIGEIRVQGLTLIAGVDVVAEQRREQLAAPALGPGAKIRRQRSAVRQVEVDRVPVATCSPSPSPTGSSRTSGAPVSTWLPGETRSSFTRAPTGRSARSPSSWTPARGPANPPRPAPRRQPASPPRAPAPASGARRPRRD